MENKFFSYGKQSIDENDIQSVIDVLKSDYLTQGPKIEEFEQALCKYTGAKYCVVVSNGTAALHIAVKALGIDNNSEGITSPITFTATPNSLVYNNIKPVFADIDENTYNIDPAQIKKQINKNTKLIIPVHFAGQTCNMEDIRTIAVQNNLKIIEDASHAIGSKYNVTDKVGSCIYSDMTVFSFHPVKTITSGEGGAITTNSVELYNKLLLLRSHGITKNDGFLSHNPGPWYYEMQTLGYNYRMTDIHAALGISQLKKIEYFKKRRNEIIKLYNNNLSNIEWIKTPYNSDNDNLCLHLYVLQIAYDKIKKNRKQVIEFLKSFNIGTQVHYIPVHLQPYYKDTFRYKINDYPVAEKYYEKALSLPLYPDLKEDEVLYIVDKIKKLENNLC